MDSNTNNTNNTNAQPLDHIERRGTLTYWEGQTVRDMDAWFMLSSDGSVVIGRKVGGRNQWLVCGVDDIIEFRTSRKAGARKMEPGTSWQARARLAAEWRAKFEKEAE